MNPINLQFIRLADPANRVRRDACEQLRFEPNLPREAIIALEQALRDPDPHLVGAARCALHAHVQDEVHPDPTTKLPPSSQSNNARSWIGSLSCGQCVFLGTGIVIVYMAALNGNWAAVPGILLFMVGSMFISGEIARKQNERVTGVWSKLARQTGLELEPGRSYLFGGSYPPVVSGVYRGHRVLVSEVVEYESGPHGEDASSAVVYTNMMLEVENAGGCHLDVGPKLVFGLFNWRGARSGNQDFDRHFRFDGHPGTFLQGAMQLIVRYPMLLDGSHDSIRIGLKGTQLSCLQSGEPTHIPGQIDILNLLCDLAELAEEAGSD